MKIKILALVLATTFVIKANAQRIAPDVLTTTSGPLTIQPIQHASLVLTVAGKIIYADPVGRRSEIYRTGRPGYYPDHPYPRRPF